MRWIALLLWLLPYYAQSQSPFEKAKSLYEARKYEEVIPMLKGIEEGSKDYAGARYLLGRIAYDQKNYDEATDYFDEAIETNDKIADYYNWLGNTYGAIAQNANPFKQGMLAPKMKNAWEKALTLDPKNLDARFSLIQYYTQAPAFMGGGIDKAKEMSKQIMAINPAQGHRTMGNILVHEKKISEAEKEYLEMVKVDQAFNPVLANFYVNQKQFDKAFAMFEDFVEKNPLDMVSVYQVGKTSAISGLRLERGEECLKKYLAYSPKPNEPSHAGANMRLAQIYEKQGQKAEAQKLYKLALSMDGKLKEAEEGLQRTSK